MLKITRIAALSLVALAVLLAIVAFSLGRNALKPSAAVPQVVGTGAASSPAPQSGLSSMVVAQSALPAGKPIAASSLHLIEQSRPAPDAYTRIDAVVGDVPLVDIPAGTTITAGLLAHGVAMVLKPGERALAVPVDELTGAGNRVWPGDYVDVFLSLKATQPTGINVAPTPAQARLLLSRMRVLAYGAQNLPDVPATTTTSEKKKSRGQDEGSQPHTAVLAVPVGVASRLLLGAQSGTLSLALRHPGDEGQPDVALFPQPRVALSPLGSLTVEQKQWLDSPENRAYAGIVATGLTGQVAMSGSDVPKRTSRRSEATSSLEIIRGTQQGDLRSQRSPSS